MTLKLYIPIGIPASGKTLYYINNFDEFSVLRISRDDLNDTLSKGNFSSAIGKVIKKIEYSAIREALRENFSVYMDRTNLTPKVRRRYINVAKEESPKIYVVALYFEPDTEESIKRNKARKNKTAEQIKGIEKWMQEAMRQITTPTFDENFNEIITIGIDGEIKKVETVRESIKKDNTNIS